MRLLMRLLLAAKPSIEDITPLPNYRLPTEAEWNSAACGPAAPRKLRNENQENRCVSILGWSSGA